MKFKALKFKFAFINQANLVKKKINNLRHG